MFLGIDIGTSEVKALLLDESQAVLDTAGASLEIARPQPGHSEQDPASWWIAVQEALHQIRIRHSEAYARVEAIGLSGQMHGAVVLDKNNAVLRPAILWNDTRSAAECEQMMAEYPQWPDAIGSLLMPGFTAPKLRWLETHEARVFSRTAMVLLPKDYVRWQLTGEHLTDMSDASGTGWLDVGKRAWSPALLSLTRLTTEQMPRLAEGSDRAGTLTMQAAHLLGLRAGIPIAGGAGDNAASAVGMGAVNPGQGFLSLGTSGVLFVVTPHYQPNPASATHAFCHAVPQRWHQMSVMLSAASCLQWAARLVGAPSAGHLQAQAAGLNWDQRATAPLFLPYLSGERTPHNNAQVRASLHQLSHDTDAAAVAYAVMEGVGFGLADGMRALRDAGCHIGQLSLVGGGARSALWAQLVATLLEVPIVTHETSAAGAALGAARLASVAAGVPMDMACSVARPMQTFVPDTQQRSMLEPRYQRFRNLYQTLEASSPGI